MTKYGPRTLAHQLAHQLAEILSPACERIEIAGSIRRGKPDPHDIELVLAPAAHFEDTIFQLDMTGVLQLDAAHKANGDRYKRRIYKDLPVDLFIVRPPAEWGLIYFIRTGSAHFAHHALSTWKRLTNGGFSKDGCLYYANGAPMHTPEEEDVFAAIGWVYQLPGDRG